ncbi:hypothetical protein KIPB_000863, partial [Kipferlia bialata]|eukprot:g863.t1
MVGPATDPAVDGGLHATVIGRPRPFLPKELGKGHHDTLGLEQSGCVTLSDGHGHCDTYALSTVLSREASNADVYAAMERQMHMLEE